jgi:hypothetical protein
MSGGVSINVGDIESAVEVIQAVTPIATMAYSLLRTIWTQMNPGKTEADFQEYLRSSSQANVDDASAILTAHGYVLQPDGSWVHTIPAPAPATPPTPPTTG